ncbi:MAG: ABC transporter ATP-binding protein/permease [Butyrivibrio sp.]|nr:ABC transporter ATP-binding protein/permease [Acetatifactor muris]MCM1560026.1 ABC transporter ATP-binding protein/permease [Butyrivibrio sp.]
MKNVKRYKQNFYKKNKLNYALTIISVIGDSITSVLTAEVLKELMDLAGSGSLEGLKHCVIMILLLLVFQCGIVRMLRMRKYNFMKKAVTGYRNQAFQDITAKSIGALSRNNSSDFISALTNDVTSIESKYLMAEFDILEALLTAVLSLALMFYYSWILTLTVIGLCILPIIVSVIFGNKVTALEKQISDYNAGFVAMVKDLLSGFGVIRSFQAQGEAGKLYGDRNEHVEQVKCRRQKTIEVINLISGITGVMVQFGVFLLGAYLSIRGLITAGVVVAFVQMMNYILGPIGALPVYLADRKAAAGLIEKLAGLTEKEEDRKTEIVSGVGEGIRFENVHFSYEEGKEVLKGVNLEFEAGKSYAVVGGSGSGKSTLLNLIMGSYDSYEGRVTMAGKDLREVKTDSIFDVVSVIQQNVFIFDDTVKQNICLFKEFPGDAVESAASRAGLKGLVAEKGWDYGCGEGGAHLSGGEKQRISIARSLLKESQVLLVDEATSSLDAETADSVTGAILDVSGLTRLVVTHRLDEKVLKRFDGIIVMRNGRVEEQGTFGELMEKKEYFYSLYQVSRE